MHTRTVLAASLIALSLSGCSFIGGSGSDTSASAPLTENSASPSTETTTNTMSGSESAGSASGPETTGGSPSQTSTLADPNEPGGALANPTASGTATTGNLPLTIRGDGSLTRSASFPAGIKGLTFKATCGTAGQIQLNLTFNGTGDARTQNLNAGPCTASQPVLVRYDAVPSGATQVTVQASSQPAGEFWLVVLNNQ